jgi:hypothetical protein
MSESSRKMVTKGNLYPAEVPADPAPVAGKEGGDGSDSLVACYVEIGGVPYEPRDPYFFQTCPRAGDQIALPIHGSDRELVRFTVQSALHVPNGADRGRSAFTVIFVQGLGVKQETSATPPAA